MLDEFAQSCLADLRFVKIIHGKDYMLFVCSLRSLPSSQPITIVMPSHTHAVPSDKRRCCCWINFKLRRVIDYERYGKVEQRRHLQPRLIGNPIASPIADQRAGQTGDFLGHAQEFV